MTEENKDQKAWQKAQKIYKGIKGVGKKALGFLIEPQKALHTGLGVLERGLNAVPLVGGFFLF